ncbi:MAG: IclR family transcriptional regulator [Desulfobacterales bacterium]|jgi:DNA-binding IclR family transcriptional regulator
MKQNRSSLNSVEKAIKILLAFKAQRPSWGVRQLSTHLQFSPATVQRLLQILKAHGFVDQDPHTRQYRLGHIYFQFLETLQQTYSITQIALPAMTALSARTQETVHLNVIDGSERLCIDSLESPRHLKASMPVGTRSPLHAGASSKCLLAFSPQSFIENYLKKADLAPLAENTITDIDRLGSEIAITKKQGFAISLGERNPGLGSLSTPILNHKGMLVAAISLAIPENRFRDSDHRNACLQALLRTAEDFSKMMGYRM